MIILLTPSFLIENLRSQDQDCFGNNYLKQIKLLDSIFSSTERPKNLFAILQKRLASLEYRNLEGFKDPCFLAGCQRLEGLGVLCIVRCAEKWDSSPSVK